MPASYPLIHILVNMHVPSYPTVTGLARPITLYSIENFVLSLAWALVLLVSFTGWGRLFAQAFQARIPSSIACALGIGGVIFLGGWLNLFHALGSWTFYALTGLGVAAYLLLREQRPVEYRWLKYWRGSTQWTRYLLIAALLIMGLRVAATIRLGMFNSFDDGSAYLTFPHKLLDVHAFAFDPFSDRRVISSLGGSYLLQAFVISATSLSHIGMADRALGLVLLAVALFDLGIACKLSTMQIGLLEFLAFLSPQETINLTFIILPTSLLLAMAWLILQTCKEDGEPLMRYALLAGMVGGGLLSLKSTFLPSVGAFCLIPFLLMYYRTRRVAFLTMPLIAGAGCLLVLASWMISMKIDSGTYLFPVLGYGVDYASHGVFHTTVKFASSRALLKIFLQGIALLALASIQIFGGIKNGRTRFSLSILLAAAFAITAFNYKSGGDFIWRYNFPQFFSAILIFYAVNAGELQKTAATQKAKMVFSVGVLSLVAMIFYYDMAGQHPRPFRQLALELKDYRLGLRASLSGMALSSPFLVDEYRAAESALPRHATAIENTAYPFLFQYKDRTLLLDDWPGAASPQPGWPFGPKLSQVASYLTGNSIRYLVYDYHYALWTDVEACMALEEPDRNSQELLQLWWMTVLAHNQFDHLRRSYRSIYDDGNLAVIDLLSPMPNAAGDDTVWTRETPKDEMCSAVTRRYLDARGPARR